MVWKILLVGILSLGIGFAAGRFYSVIEVQKETVTALDHARVIARDSERQHDLQSLGNALATVIDKDGHYPQHSDKCIPFVDLSVQLKQVNIDTAPIDPNHKADDQWPDYCYQSDAKGDRFVLWAKLENSDDQSRYGAVGAPPLPDGFTVPAAYLPNAFGLPY